jgi:F0F1-type ATP synthase membrane subunit b/b'
MRLNLTLFIQMFQFFIAYALLKRFFFAPFLRNIAQRRQREEEIKARCRQRELRLQEIDHHRSVLLTSFQERAREGYDAVAEVACAPSTPVAYIEQSDFDVAKLVEQAQHMIEKRVINDYESAH